MRNTLTVALVAFFLFITQPSVAQTTTIEYQIKKSYLLLPIQEDKGEVPVIVTYPNGEKSPTCWIRLAENKIDYWVKLDVKKYIGKKISLAIENATKKELGIKSIQQSNKLSYQYAEKYRPLYHFSPPYGWMNDPNGLVFFQGEYHLFYQYNPYASVWGNMHWGHAVSKNLIDWQYLPIAIYPDSLGTIFSGSAVIDTENTAGFGKNAMVAIYTNAGEKQTQCIAYSNDKGRTFTKYAHNPVIKNPGIVDFRDPKVFWHKETSQWIMTLATKQTVTFYGSTNLKEWNKLSEFGEGIGNHGGVWECPDLLYFPPKATRPATWVLTVNINPGGPNGGSATQYFIGDFNGTVFTPQPLPYPLWLDQGKDNYAGVTWSNLPQNDDRHLFIGWMTNLDYGGQTPTEKFRSIQTVPRELNLATNGKHLILASYPAKEVLSGFQKAIAKPDIEVTKEVELTNILANNKGAYKIEMTIIPHHALQFGFGLFNAKQETLNFNVDGTQKTLTVHREHSGNTDFNQRFSTPVVTPLIEKEEYHITLLVDKCSAELFINQGEQVMTSLFFPSEVMNNLKFYSSEKMEVKNISVSALREKYRK